MDIFNNREIALAIWLLITLCLLLIKKDIRKSIAGVVVAMFQTKLSLIYFCATLYTALIVFILYYFNLWDNSQLKNTIVWLLTAGFISLFEVTKAKTNFFKEALKDIFKFTVLLEFIINVYTFNLAIELLIIPIVTFFSVLLGFSKQEKKYNPVTKLLNGTLALIGFLVILYSLYQIITHFKSFATTGTLSDFLIPPTLSLLFIPFVYLLSIMMSYEISFIKLKSSIEKKKILKYAKRQAIIRFRFDRNSLDRWVTLVFQKRLNTKKEINRSIKLIKRLKRIERNPPKVPIELGWSPYKAKHFLTKLGLPTGYYNPHEEDEWFACSISLKVEGSDFLSNNISYYIEGNEYTVVKLDIRLDVYDTTKAKAAHQTLLSFSEELYKSAIGKDLPDKVGSKIASGAPITLFDENRKITVSKWKWPEHPQNAYTLHFIIQVMSENNC